MDRKLVLETLTSRWNSFFTGCSTLFTFCQIKINNYVLIRFERKDLRRYVSKKLGIHSLPLDSSIFE